MSHTISSPAGLEVTLSPIGASMQSLIVPDANGNPVDVLLGFEKDEEYRANPLFLGATVGRCANRIRGARFWLGGREHVLTANDGTNCNHSGRDFWAERVWDVVGVRDDCVTYSLHSPNGDQGFPGTADVLATFRVEGLALDLRYEARLDEPTVVNMTSHGYFNLNGHASGSAMGHLLQIDAQQRLVCDETVLPTGEVAEVADTPWDFRELRPIDLSLPTSGFDNCFLLENATQLRRVARLVGERSGIAMDLLTDQPGLQLYTANFASVSCAKGGASYQPRDAVCLEPGLYPDAISHPEWPSPVFSPERPYSWHMRLEFSCEASTQDTAGPR